jgi:hypothetical protein
MTVTLAGQTSSSWATDAIIKIAAAIKTDSDGYTMQMDVSSNDNTIATGPTKMGMESAAGTLLCPKTMTVTLAGQTSSSWATDAIVKIATAIKTDSDGYTMQMDVSSNANTIGTGAANKNEWMGGCLTGAGANVKNDAVCFWGRIKDGKLSNVDADKLTLQDMWPRHMPIANFKTTAAVTGDTKITTTKWNVVFSGNDCTKTQELSAPDPKCGTTGNTFADARSWNAKWFQPKEISTKLYVGLPRFSAKETATWTAIIRATGYKAAGGCSAKALTGASALVAGAAVAFGAAALAF